MPDIDHLVFTRVVLEEIAYDTTITHLVLDEVPFVRVVQQAADPDRPDDVVLLPVSVLQQTLKILKGH